MGNSATSACRLTVLVLAFSVPAVLWHPGALAQGYPAKPIRIIASSAAGAHRTSWHGPWRNTSRQRWASR